MSACIHDAAAGVEPALVVDNSLSGARVARDLDAIIAVRGAPPLMIVSDNGTELTTLARKAPIAHDMILYRQRHGIENMFGSLKGWPRIHTRYDRCDHTFFSAISRATTIIFWLPQ